MPRKGHSEEQILFALRQVEGGQKVSEVCREVGVSPQQSPKMLAPGLWRSRSPRGLGMTMETSNSLWEIHLLS